MLRSRCSLRLALQKLAVTVEPELFVDTASAHVPLSDIQNNGRDRLGDGMLDDRGRDARAKALPPAIVPRVDIADRADAQFR